MLEKPFGVTVYVLNNWVPTTHINKIIPEKKRIKWVNPTFDYPGVENKITHKYVSPETDKEKEKL